MPGYFAHPKVTSNKRFPTVLLIHGKNGFWGKNENWTLEWLEILVESGFCVLAIDNFGFLEAELDGESQFNMIVRYVKER